MTLSWTAQLDFRKRVAGVLARGVLVLVMAAPAGAQIGLPESVTNPPSGVLTAEDKDQIKKLIDANKAGLSGEADAVSRARRALLSPFRGREVSAPFRVEYAQQLIPVIRPLATDKNDQTAINATIIAGELGTKDAMGVLSTALKDSRAPVRLVAAEGFARSFMTVRSGQPAIIARDALAALKDLDAALAAESEPHVADALASAIDAAVRSSSATLPGVRTEAVRVMAAGAGARVRDGKSIGLASAFARAGDSLLDAVNENAPGASLSTESLVEAAGFAGDIIAMAVRADPATLPPQQLADVRQLLKQAENIYFFSHPKLDSSAKPIRAGLGDSFGADQSKFKKDALQILDVLTDPSKPFKLKKDRFPTR